MRTHQEKPVYTDVEECIERAGGTGKFQYIAFTLIVLGMACGAFILYSIAYFTKVPPLLCQTASGSAWTSCTKDEACSSSYFAFKADPDAVDTLTNWISRMDLYCTGDFEMSLIGSMFFVGTFTGSFVLPRLADVYGRKPLFLVGLSLYICVVVALYYCENLSLLYVLLYLGGVSETGRYYVAYVYVVEMMPRKVQSAAGLYIFLVFGVAMTYIAIQFWFFTKDVYVNNFIALGLALMSLVSVTVWLPESPRFLYSSKQFDKAKQVIAQIARVNGKEEGLTDFDFEVETAENSVVEMGKIDINNTTSRSASDSQPQKPDEAQQVAARNSIAKVSPEEIEEASNVMSLQGTIGELFSIRVYRTNLLVMMVVWSFASFAFFLIPLYIGQVDLNIFLISICLAIAEIISSLVCLFIVHGRDLRKSLIFFCAMSCIGSAACFTFQSVYKGDSQIPVAVAYLILYVGIVTAFDLVYLIVNELFPTIFLATAYGGCNVVGRFISILSPLMAYAGDYIPMLTLIAFSGVCIVLPMCLVKVDMNDAPTKDAKRSSKRMDA